jgi:hypothetical protein
VIDSARVAREITWMIDADSLTAPGDLWSGYSHRYRPYLSPVQTKRPDE